MEETKFTDIVLPVPVPRLFTYRVPRNMEDKVKEGQRVAVQFGKRKMYAGLVRRIHNTPPEHYEAKYIEAVLDDDPLVTEEQFKFWEWVSDYYLCTLGEVMNAALPSSLKLASETRVMPVKNPQGDTDELTDQEFMVHEAMEVQEVLTLEEIGEITGRDDVMALVRSLIEKGYVVVEEEMREKYSTKKEQIVVLDPEMTDDKLRETFDLLEKKAPKQMEMLLSYMNLKKKDGEVPKLALQKSVGADSSIVRTMEEKGIFAIKEREVGRLSSGKEGEGAPKELSEAQHETGERIRQLFKEKGVVLLHGVTSSGKTEVYVHLIREQLEKGNKVLYLLPEIALTTQLISRLQFFFGDRVGVYHSRFNSQERAEVYHRSRSTGEDRYDVLIGARSAVFLPIKELGLVIIDEEHENTFKQFEPAPRYHGRDAAIMLARMNDARVLMGTATPSVESYYNARSGKYGYVELTERYGGVQLPEILCADVKKEMKRKTMKSLFSSLLMEHMQEALERKEQVILFQNRRGYSPIMRCMSCGWVPQCKRCDISLNYHKLRHRIACHYCGYDRKPPRRCDACGSGDVRMYGFGTEKIEEELGIYFPDAKVSRMDLDTTRSKNAYAKMISAFEKGEMDILVGTQMVTKGLDFDNVGLVGILSADNMLDFPDFRAHERSFQLMGQVAGRAGRKEKRGTVVIQSFNPHHQVIRHVIGHQVDGHMREELLERRNFKYPPFSRLIRLTLRHKEVEKVDKASDALARRLHKAFGQSRVLGPEFPPVPRVRNQYNKNILIKLEKGRDPEKAKKLLLKAKDEVFEDQAFKPVRVIFDVDPV